MHTHDTPPPGTQEEENGYSDLQMIDLANMLLRHLRALILLPLVFAALALGYSLWSAEYTASSRFMPRTTSSSGGLARMAGLAAQFGVNMPIGKEGETVDFYAELLRSFTLLSTVAQDTFHVAPLDAEGDTLSGTYMDLLEIEGDTEAERLRTAVESLRGRVTSSADMKANLVTVESSAPWPDLAEQLNRRLLDLVAEFNVETRQSQATMERRFVEERLEEAKRELEKAEQALSDFLDSNRSYQTAPHRVAEFERLQRTLTLRQQVYTTLAQSYEQSRIEEVRDMPVITVMDGPEGVAEPKGSLVLNVLLGAIVGLILGGGLAILREFGSLAQRSAPAAYAEFYGRLRYLMFWRRS